MRPLLNYYMRQLKLVTRETVTRASLVAKFLCVLHVTNNYFFSSSLVYGPSMLPTLNKNGDVVLVEHVSHRLGKVGPGDVVLVKSPVDPRKNLTKRVLAMEGDKVTFFTDPRDPHLSSPTVEVPKGHVWIQGDNVYASHDSRHFGPVPYGLIQGKVFLRRRFRESESVWIRIRNSANSEIPRLSLMVPRIRILFNTGIQFGLSNRSFSIKISVQHPGSFLRRVIFLDASKSHLRPDIPPSFFNNNFPCRLSSFTPDISLLEPGIVHALDNAPVVPDLPVLKISSAVEELHVLSEYLKRYGLLIALERWRLDSSKCCR
ncbi:hypothetical protein ACFE04_011303 [Oxalis oulophora]